MTSRGRKPGHDNHLSATETTATYLFLKRQIDGDLKSADISSEIREFGKTQLEIPPSGRLYEDCNEDMFNIDTILVDRIIRNKGFNNEQSAKALFFLFKSKYGNMFDIVIREVEITSKEPFSVAASDLFGYHGFLHASRAEEFSGIYKAYRPFHLKPTEKIALCKLIIGGTIDGKKSAFNCEFTTKWQEVGRNREHISKGKIILHGEGTLKLSAMTTGRGPSHFIMHFDHMQPESYGMDELSGVLIAAYGADPSSAWPIYAVRADEGDVWEPGTIERADFSSVPEEALRRLNRGAVYWRPEDYPKPPIF